MQRQKYTSRLLKSEKNLLETTNKCLFYMKEYNNLKNRVYEYENQLMGNNEKKMYYGKKALIGDYLSISYKNTKDVLEKLGFNVDIVHNSEDLFYKIKYGEQYDIIFSNNIYRDGTGTECLNKLKKLKNFATPVIIHTVSKNKKNYFVNEIGFNGYIEKPVTEEKVIPILDEILKIKEQ